MLNGTIYDVLPHEFGEERNQAGEYIPLRDRSPSVRYNLGRVVVEDSIALLFGEGRFPVVESTDEPTREALAELIKETKLNRTMSAAAFRGSVGSVVVRLRVLNSRVFFDVMPTLYLTAAYDPQAPDTLQTVTEQRKVRGVALRASGYQVSDDDLNRDFWFMRQWDAAAEMWFQPWLVKATDQDKREQKPVTPGVVDTKNTVRHNLGFVPLVWIENLPGGDGPDGGCTFRPAIETAIEIDYQLSQAGRGLKYSSDPLLLIKEPAAAGEDLVRSAGNALVVTEKGDARLLEIGGSAAAAVIEYVRTLREVALESIHGNRSNADKLSAAVSGRALELLHQPLIWLADQLRISYGEDGLLRLLNMVVAASHKMPLLIGGKKVKALSPEPLILRWPNWFAPTARDRVEMATALRTHTDAGHMSRQTAVATIAPSFDVENPEDEVSRIQSDLAEQEARAVRLKAQVQDKGTVAN